MKRVLSVLTLLAMSSGMLGQEITETKLIASDGAEGDWFGGSASISGDYALVGAYLDDGNNGTNSGSAYVFERDRASNWSEGQKLTASDGASMDRFGRGVSISGNYAVIGAVGDDDAGDRSGSAYVFERQSNGHWLEVQKLTAFDAAAVDQFGFGVSISGDYAVVGAPYDDNNNGTDAGSAYVFERDGAGNWIEVQKLTAFDGAVSDIFGSRVSISGDYAVISAFLDDDNGIDSGSAYVFERDGLGNWNEVQKLTALDGATDDKFGRRVSISGDHAVIGAYHDDDDGSNSGSAYLFERDRAGSWSQVQNLTASDGAAEDLFGDSVSISGDYAVIGAYGDDDNGETSGSAYVFERNAGGIWQEIHKLSASDGSANDVFGYSTSISGNAILIGAFYDDDNGENSGSAYVYNIEEATVCPGDATGDLVVDVVDFSQLLIDFGQSGPGLSADFNGDNIVDVQDFSILLVNFGNSCE